MKAKAVNKFNFITSVIVFSLILVFGIGFLTLFLIFNKDVPENYIEENATITEIEKELSPVYDESDGIDDSDYEYRVFVEYSYNDKLYTEKEYGRYDSKMKKGDKVIVYINPDNPEEFMSDTSGDFVFVIIGIVIILVGAGGIGYNIFKKKKGA